MKKNIKFVSALTAVVCILPGCARYKAQPLQRLFSHGHVHETEKLRFAYKIFTQADCSLYFDRDVIKAGYQPIQITIENNSQKVFTFSPSHFSLPTVPPNIVADHIRTSTGGRILAWGIPGLFIFPLLIPAAVDGVWSAEANAKLEKDMAAKSLTVCTIEPYETFNGVLFVPVDQFKNEFSLTLVDKETREKVSFGS